MPFELPDPTTVKVAHLNVRAELHGDETHTAIDLRLARTCGNDCLNAFAPGLREALYYRAGETEAQADVPGVEKLLPNLRFPLLGDLVLAHEIIGAEVTVDYGIGAPIVLGLCKVNKFRCELAEGGSVTTTFRVQCSDPPEGALDKLGKLLDSEAQITLKLPTEKPPAIDGTTGHPGVADLEKARKAKGGGADATQAFLEAQGA